MRRGRHLLWHLAGYALMMSGLFFGTDRFRDGDPAWVWNAACVVVGLAVITIVAIRRWKDEKREAAEKAAAPPAPPDPRRWRIVEIRNDED
ncbi:hypothetical protein ACFDTO_08135 [Microbacteriaceae bacterium 4G12]